MPTRTQKTEASSNAGSEAVAAFLDLAGHELRGPITSLKGQAQLFRRRLARQPDRETDVVGVNKMLYQIERLEHELDVYLEAARLQHKRVQVMPEMCDLVDLVRNLVALYAQSASSVAVRMESDLGTLFGMWDKRRVRLALGVLLANAVKYGGEGDILVRVFQTAAAARIEVFDQGIGIPPKERGAIFKAYTTGSNAENSGVGLGLYVARALARQHHGTVGVRAREGGGSVFWLELPLAPRAGRRTVPHVAATNAQEPSLAGVGHSIAHERPTQS